MVERSHRCRDGVVYFWRCRIGMPKECPRCKQRLDVCRRVDRNDKKKK